MNEEKKIAQAIIKAHKIHENSYDEVSSEYVSPFGFCFRLACENHRLSPNLYEVLVLANHWYNDLADWAKFVLEGVKDEKASAKDNPERPNRDECKAKDILTEKLTVEELSILCDCYDDGSLDDVFSNVLIPIDFKNHPEKYVVDDGEICEG